MLASIRGCLLAAGLSETIGLRRLRLRELPSLNAFVSGCRCLRCCFVAPVPPLSRVPACCTIMAACFRGAHACCRFLITEGRVVSQTGAAGIGGGGASAAAAASLLVATTPLPATLACSSGAASLWRLTAGSGAPRGSAAPALGGLIKDCNGLPDADLPGMTVMAPHSDILGSV